MSEIIQIGQHRVRHGDVYDDLSELLQGEKADLFYSDPCCGLGYTARFAVDHGMTFYGNELNRKRLERTIERLSK